MIAVKKVFNSLIFVFLLGNLVIRFGSIFNYPPYNGFIAGFLGAVVAACVFVVFRPGYLKYLLFIFGFSFFLYGFGSIDIQSRIFELLVTLVAATLFVINWRERKDGGQIRRLRRLHGLEEKGKDGVNRPLVILFWCYVALSAFSLMLVPVRTIFKDLWYFGFPDAFFYLFIGPPYGIYYPGVAVLRLMLFGVLALVIARMASYHENYKWLFSGIFISAVFSTIVGLMDLYGLISLAPYRFGITAGVLQSTFLNRGWFAEFLLVAMPFVLIGFMSMGKGRSWKIMLFASLVLCEIALILAGARAGWVAYPLILFICWLFFYYSQSDRLASFRFSWKYLVKVGISVPITIAISFLIVFQVLMPLSNQIRDTKQKADHKKFKATDQYLERRVTEFTKTGRIGTWKDSTRVGLEGPWFGRGYEAYYWNATVLENIPSSPYMENRVHKKIRQTPHSIFVQLFVSGGIVGLCLWLIIMGYAITLLVFDVIKNKRLLNIPVIVSIISFHTYGIFQSMQYIPMIWLIIFLCLGYAMTIDEGVLSVRFSRVMGVLTKVSVVLVVIGLFVYLSNFESRSLAEKYGLKIYAMNQDRDKFAGFFQHSQRWKYGDYRWFSKRGAISIAERGVQGEKDEHRTSNIERPTSNGREGEDSGQRVVEVEFYCRTPGVEKEPVVLKVFHEGKLIDTIIFRTEGAVKRRYGFKAERVEGTGEAEGGGQRSDAEGKEQRLVIEVSRTWSPHEVLGNFDRREMGIGVKIVSAEN